MQEHVFVFRKYKPYPYINVCNIYIQASRYEGKGVIVRVHRR